MRKPARFFSLSKPKLRQSWNKYNMYNIYRRAANEPPIRGTPTFFQQKWGAKSRARAYHGEHIPEKKWVRLFSPRLLSAVDMPPEYLAAHNGSEQSAGRGSGLSTSNVNAEAYSRVPRPAAPAPNARRDPTTNDLISRPLHDMTPYMQMTFAPLERRLDTAIFRAMFATSVRQARQFVLHGAVKVNGKKLLHPSYQLNPGDMFQVDVEKVMYATGVQKTANATKRLEENLAARKQQADRAQKALASNGMATAAEGEGDAAAGEGEGQGQAALPELSEDDHKKFQQKSLNLLVKDVKKLLKSEGKNLSVRERKQLRLFRSDAKRVLSRPHDSELDAAELMQELQLHMKNQELLADSFSKLSTREKAAGVDETLPEQEAASEGGEAQTFSRKKQFDKTLEGLSEEQKERAVGIVGDERLSNEDMRKLKALLLADEENPVDETKPYATPWAPRPFMAAFAFVPRYLEVNHEICAAVYLRHPVARKGHAEVPTPFNYLTNQLAHNWYLQRG